MTLYETLKRAGCEISHHESDLYVKYTEDARHYIRYWLAEKGIDPIAPKDAKRRAHWVKLFADQKTGSIWADIPFAYDPFWEAVTV